MALDDVTSNLIFFLRWAHILAGIIWIGHLYFFNFVNGPFQAKLDKQYKPVVNPLLMPRALWWFRWGAMMTLVFGLIMFMVKYGANHGQPGGLLIDSDGKITDRALWIMIGMGLGIIMWFNVWFIIWPAQKKIIPWTRDGQSPPEMAGLVKRAGLFSRINTYLSGPMLFCMIAPNNYGSFSLVTLIVVSAIALISIWGFIKMGPKVGATI